jgi:sirohydrochlorin cobaltochelatase
MASATTESTGLLLVGHGTREPQGLAEVATLAAEVKRLKPHWPVEHCFLELAEPTIQAGVTALLKQNVKQIIVAPLLLFAAGHAKRDVPEQIQAALAGRSDVDVMQLPAFGSHPLVLQLSQVRLARAELIAGPTRQPGNQATVSERLLLVVGRGSSDPVATSTLREFTARRATQAQVAVAMSCFVAIQRPNLAEALQICRDASQTEVIVQPHLLFCGQLLDEIRAAVENIAKQPAVKLDQQKSWYLAPHLGPHALLAQAIAEMANKFVKIL